MPIITRLAPDTVRLERRLAAPIETVWRHLVDPDLRALWFAGGETEARPGGRIDLIFDHDNLSADEVPYPEAYAPYQGVTSHQQVVRCDPPHVFAFTFEGNGIATFELFAEGQATRLVLTHSGIVESANLANFGGGWASHLAVLEARFGGAAVRDFWALHAACEAEVAADLAAG